MTCCDDPRPRVSDVTGRFFCTSCRRYLDRNPAAQDTRRDDSEVKATSDAHQKEAIDSVEGETT